MNCRGFTLAEIAIVLFIMLLLLGGLLVPLSAQIEIRSMTEAQRTLADVREALLGFAVSRRRLPCPATDGSPGTTNTRGQESFSVGGDASTGACASFYAGFVPAAALGLTPTDTEGFLVDPWRNRIRYAVFAGDINGSAHALTRYNGMRDASIEGLGAPGTTMIYVCDRAIAGATTDCGSGAIALGINIPFVVYSVGPNGASPTGGAGVDEGANPNPHGGSADLVFVSHEQTGTASNSFDDLLTWTSINTLISRMIASRALP
jgi:type II secretory pathway pseudopilin PulG